MIEKYLKKKSLIKHMKEAQQHKGSIDDYLQSTTGFLLIPSSFIGEFRYIERRMEAEGEEVFKGTRSIDRYVCYALLFGAETTRLWIYWDIIKDYVIKVQNSV